VGVRLAISQLDRALEGLRGRAAADPVQFRGTQASVNEQVRKPFRSYAEGAADLLGVSIGSRRHDRQCDFASQSLG